MKSPGLTVPFFDDLEASWSSSAPIKPREEFAGFIWKRNGLSREQSSEAPAVGAAYPIEIAARAMGKKARHVQVT
jgi:hypothetical protein